MLLNKLMFDGLLDKHRPDLADEITEMLGRLHPPTGARVVPVLTDYTNPKKSKKVEFPAIDWKAEAVLRRPVDGMDERFGESLDSVRYRKD